MNVSFLSPLDVEKLDSGRWRVLRDLRATLSDGAQSRSFCVREGYETDFASVPRLPFVFWIMGDTVHRAAVLHDFLYSSGKDTAGAGVSRQEADAIFLAAMKADGVPAWRRGLMWAGVRLFGGAHFEGAR